MNTKSKQKFDYKKIETHSLIIRKILKRKKKQQWQTSKRLDKKESLKKPTKDDFREFSERANKKEISINSELFKNILVFKGLVLR